MAESIAHTGKGMKLHTKILLGLLIGAVVGITANQVLGGDHGVVVFVNKYLATPVGQIFLRLLFMIVIPLVFASISLGVAGLGDLRRVGRVGAKAIGYFLVSTALAATLGLIAVSIVRPGEQLDRATAEQLRTEFSADASSRVEAAASSDFGVNTIINMFPRNPVRAAVDLDMLAIITFALIFGAALTLITAERAKPMLSWLEALQDVVIKIVEMAMRFAPYGVAALDLRRHVAIRLPPPEAVRRLRPGGDWRAAGARTGQPVADPAFGRRRQSRSCSSGGSVPRS